MTNERIKQIVNALMENEAEIKSLFELSPSDAANKLADKGYNFSEEELIEFGKILDDEKKKLDAGTELTEDALENVAGGVGLITAAVVGVCVGYWVYGQKW